MISSIILLLGVIALYSAIFTLKKTKHGQPIVTWVAVSFLIFVCTNVFFGGLFSLVHIPVCALSIGLFDLALGAVGWTIGLRKLGKQAYEKIAVADIAAVVMILLVSIVFAIKQYGTALSPNFLVADGTAHYMEAMRVVRDQNLVDMYYHSLFNALLIEFFEPFVAYGHWYQAYCLGVLINMFMSGLIIFGTIRPLLKDRFMQIAGVVAPLLYMAGYPMNAYLYGFIYLDQAITLTLGLVLITELVVSEEMDERIGTAILLLGCTAMVVCYALFAPLLFVSIFLRVSIWQLKKKRIAKAVVLDLIIFVVPIVYALLFTYRGIFVTDDLTVGGSIKEEGSIYRDLFSTFVWWLPFAIYGIYMAIKRKSIESIHWFAGITLLNSLAFLLAARLGIVSTYYYYKYHYLLWAFLIVLTVDGLAAMSNEIRNLATCMLAVWAAVFVMFIGKIDTRLWLHNQLLASPKAGSLYNNLYDYNLMVVAADQGDDYFRRIPNEKVELLNYAATNLENEIHTDEFMAIMPWSDSYFCIAQLDLENRYFDWWPNGPADYTQEYKDMARDAKYVLVTGDSLYYFEPEIFEDVTVLYENEHGFVGVRK